MDCNSERMTAREAMLNVSMLAQGGLPMTRTLSGARLGGI